MSVQDLEAVNDYNIKCGGFRLITNPSANSVLTSDSSGNGTWQAPNTGQSKSYLISGSGSGTMYTLTDSSGSYVDVDGPNLKTTILIPASYQLIVTCRIQFLQLANSATAQGVAIVDTTTGQILDCYTCNGSTNRVTQSLTLIGYVNGDGGMHTISLQYANGGAVTMNIGNNPINSTLQNGNYSTTTPIMSLQVLPL